MLNLIKSFRSKEDGIAAIEFALIFPVLLVICLGVIEFSNYTMIERRASLATDFAADYLSRDDDGTLELPERWIVEDIWMMVNPTSFEATQARGGQWANGYSRAFASAKFDPVDSNCLGVGCEFDPQVQWSFLFQDIIANPVRVQCEVEIVGNSVPLDGTKIPEGMTGRAPIVIVDFVYPYKPLLGERFFPEQEKHVTAIRKSRDGITLQHVTDSFVEQC
ncbi:MAG: TadE/TadG family type IV pilus assembly protein [Pseudomonadota bacterium]